MTPRRGRGRPPGPATRPRAKVARRYFVRRAAAWSDELQRMRERIRRMHRTLAAGGCERVPLLDRRVLQLAVEVHSLMEEIRTAVRDHGDARG